MKNQREEPLPMIRIAYPADRIYSTCFPTDGTCFSQCGLPLFLASTDCNESCSFLLCIVQWYVYIATDLEQSREAKNNRSAQIARRLKLSSRAFSTFSDYFQTSRFHMLIC